MSGCPKKSNLNGSPHIWASTENSWVGTCGHYCGAIHCPRAMEALKRHPLEGTMILSGSTTVAECASLMREHGVGSALISDVPGKIEGIFTDRDLFLKMNAETPVWKLPLRSVMTQPVITLPSDQIHLAAQVLAENGIHHLPIVTSVNEKDICVLGVVTMQALFRQNVESLLVWSAGSKTAAAQLATVGVICEDRLLGEKMVEALAQTGRATARYVPRKETLIPGMLEAVSDSFKSFIIDVDGFSIQRFKRILQCILKSEKKEKVILLFTPDDQTAETRSLLESIRHMHFLSLIQKPAQAVEVLKALKYA